MPVLGISNKINTAMTTRAGNTVNVSFTGRLDIAPDKIKIEPIPVNTEPSRATSLAISVEKEVFNELKTDESLELWVEAIIGRNWIVPLSSTEGEQTSELARDLMRDLMDGRRVELRFPPSHPPESLEKMRLNIFIVDNLKKIRAAALKLRIKPRVESLIPTELDDIGSVVWRLDWEDDMDGPTLKINSRVPELKQRLQSDDYYAALIIPAVFREVLIRMAWEALEEDGGPWNEDWRRRWKIFIRELLNDEKWDFGQLLRKEVSEIDMDEINEIVNKLAEKHKLLDGFVNRILNI